MSLMFLEAGKSESTTSNLSWERDAREDSRHAHHGPVCPVRRELLCLIQLCDDENYNMLKSKEFFSAAFWELWIEKNSLICVLCVFCIFWLYWLFFPLFSSSLFLNCVVSAYCSWILTCSVEVAYTAFSGCQTEIRRPSKFGNVNDTFYIWN